MSKMGQLHMEVLELLADGYTYDQIRAITGMPWTNEELQEIFQEHCDEICYDDSMDGDAASALVSAGFGTDEDYGYAGEEF